MKLNNFDLSKGMGLLWFLGEIAQITIFSIGSIALLWFYAPFSFWGKIGITLFSGIVLYDMFRHFVYVRYALWKEDIELKEEKEIIEIREEEKKE